MTGSREFGRLVRAAGIWVERQRSLHRRAARPLTGAESAELRDHFPPALLRGVRLRVTDTLVLPDFAHWRGFRLAQLLRLSDIEAVCFRDTVVFARRRMPRPENVLPVLFHEVVHAHQYSRLGVRGFLERYLRGWMLRRPTYEGISLERQAYRLERAFRAGRLRGPAMPPAGSRR